MMRCCKIISDRIPQAKFLFISPHRHEIILNAAKEFSIAPEKIMVKHAKRHEVPTLLSLSSYSLFFIKSCYSKISSSPTKHGEIMAMGIPVITNEGVGDVADIVNKYNAGIVLSELNDTSFAQAAEQMKYKTFDRDEIRKGAVEFYNLESAVEKYLKVYRIIFNQSTVRISREPGVVSRESGVGSLVSPTNAK
jgi:glycosyltransferase involved in cell wall biosynthesis